MPPPGIAGAVSFFGISATIASVVIRRPATETAPCRAQRSGHRCLRCKCPLLGVKRTGLLRCKCPLMTQSGHGPRPFRHSFELLRYVVLSVGRRP
jgi:hypothetical protein